MPLVVADTQGFHTQRDRFASAQDLGLRLGHYRNAGVECRGIGVENAAVLSCQHAAILPANKRGGHLEDHGRLVIAGSCVIGPRNTVGGPLPLITLYTHRLNAQGDIAARLDRLRLRLCNNSDAKAEKCGFGIENAAVRICQHATVLASVLSSGHLECEGCLVVSRTGVIDPGFTICGILPLISADAHRANVHHDRIAHRQRLAFRLGHNGHRIENTSWLCGQSLAVKTRQHAAILPAVLGF